MNAEKLRLGNYVTINNSEYWPQLKGVLMRVCGISEKEHKDFPDSKWSISLIDTSKFPSTYSQFNQYIEPIELTEEWLIKFGFHKHRPGAGGQDQWAGLTAWSIHDSNWLFRGSPNDLRLVGYFNTKLKYVHELQNLYFFLTGEELKLITI